MQISDELSTKPALHDTINGRIKLTVPQIVWGLGVLTTILAAWFNLGNKLDLLRQEVMQIHANQTTMSLLVRQHELLPGHAGVIERINASEKRIERLESRRSAN